MRTRQLQGIFISGSWSDSLGRFWPHCTMVIYDAAFLAKYRCFACVYDPWHSGYAVCLLQSCGGYQCRNSDNLTVFVTGIYRGAYDVT